MIFWGIWAGTKEPERAGLPKAVKSLEVDPELLKDSIEQGRANIASAMNGNCCSPAILVPPSFMASRLARSLESEFGGHSLDLRGAGTRHARFRSCRVARPDRSRGVPLRSVRTP